MISGIAMATILASVHSSGHQVGPSNCSASRRITRAPPRSEPNMRPSVLVAGCAAAMRTQPSGTPASSAMVSIASSAPCRTRTAAAVARA